MHTPVLLKEVIKFLSPQAGEFIVDGTIDGGGHALAIAEKIGLKGKLLGVDLDGKMLANCKVRMANRNNIILVNGNYANLPEILQEKKLDKADGLLLDLGFSSEQLENSGRGFSFSSRTAGEPLLMTYDDRTKPVRQVLQDLDERELAKIIFSLSGEKFAMRIARSIKERQKRGKMEMAGNLRDAIVEAVPKNYERGRIDPGTRTFQALRIYVNRELENLEALLGNLPRILKNGGRAVIISFHSLEDKIVKNKFREMDNNGTLQILTKKPIVPSEEEIAENPRCRSAKLRAIKLLRN